MAKLYIRNRVSSSSQSDYYLCALLIPEEYKNTTVTIKWYVQGEGTSSRPGYKVHSHLQLRCRLDDKTPIDLSGYKSADSMTGNIPSESGNTTITIGNESIIKFNFSWGRTVSEEGGSGGFNPSLSWTSYVQLPFGGIESESYITAAKLNQIAAAQKNAGQISETIVVNKGNSIIRTPYSKMGTFNAVKPLKSDLINLLSNTVSTNWYATGQNVTW